MNVNSHSPERIPPANLYWVIYKAILGHHITATSILTEPPKTKPTFNNDEEVIDEFHHIFDRAGDPYSRIVLVDEGGAGSDIDPESDDDSPDVESSMVAPGIGLIRINRFRYQTCSEEFRSAFAQLPCTSLVIDLRDNPGGLHFEALNIAQSLLDEGNLGSQLIARAPLDEDNKDTAPTQLQEWKMIDYELTKDALVTTTSNTDGSNQTSETTERLTNISDNKPIVVLVNQNTKSAAEVLASVLQENGRAKLIGKRTFGKGRGTSNLKIPNGWELQVLGFYWFTPNGECVGAGTGDVEGITPDIEMATPEDSWLDHAVNLLTQADSPQA